MGGDRLRGSGGVRAQCHEVYAVHCPSPLEDATIALEDMLMAAMLPPLRPAVFSVRLALQLIRLVYR